MPVPVSTHYDLIYQKSDYRLAHNFMKSVGQEKIPLTFPTIMASREGEVVGMIGTRPHKDAIIAGPLLVNLPHPQVVILHLFDSYELVMRKLGVEAYHFSIDKSNEQWKHIVEKALSLEPYGETDEYWYRRSLT